MISFKDIQQQCYYSLINSTSIYSLPTFIEEIDDYIKCDNLVLTPDFQRGHVWTESQQISFIENLLQGGARHARGILLNVPHRLQRVEYNECVLVDGLQRYTSILKFIKNELKCFNHYFNEFKDSPDRTVVFMTIAVNTLTTKKEVLEWYLSLNDTGVHHTSEELNRVKQLMQQC